MPRIQWDLAGQRLYHTGVDQGVFYLDTIAVPWLGLTSVEESPSSGDAQAIYLDAQKVLNIPGGEDFDATINAYAFPHEFAPCAGRVRLAAGFYAADQPKVTFGFSYRTIVGNDAQGNDFAHKTHLIYNALADIADFTNTTGEENISLKSYSFGITTVPIAVPNYRPTAHFVFDSRTTSPGNITFLQDLIYGTDTTAARMPTVDELITLLPV